VLQLLGVRRAMVVCGSVGAEVLSPESKAQSQDHASRIQHPGSGNTRHAIRNTQHDSTYLDELSTLGPNTIAEFYQDHGFTTSVLSPEAFPLQPASLADLIGGDCQANAAIVRRLLAGEERGPKRDAVLLNTAAALFVAGRTRSLAEGWDLATETIDAGKASAKLSELATTR
jgi:anthranilate phosphoribosyltransferase